MDESANESGKLKWQCRRGSLELDLILQKYLEIYYPLTDADERAHFVKLLQLEDTELLPIMLEKIRPIL